MFMPFGNKIRSVRLPCARLSFNVSISNGLEAERPFRSYRPLGTAARWISVQERCRPLPNRGGGGNPVLAKAACLLPSSPDQVSQADRCCASALVLWSRIFDWKEALTVVTPATFVRWHRESFKLYWRWKSSTSDS